MPDSNIVRIFVSSTFSDFEKERDALQEKVFLRLQKLCMDEGMQFQAVDLRWGVSAERRPFSANNGYLHGGIESL